ncbi:MAG: hypothetical protein KUA43_17645 [Hoeflea sp.]|nr:hypothetical protein [Hoeflea sp.]MBU4529101.1 hypothetical protein [Alphaproteobacteria bacterium]MBU4543506.1 hypothetical protein [Alphaproteobacteria bacterium]MBU4549131.1 hypothetical protein [Alphaproteobacteria bacterium]MBV1725266.1 hypothetical protein [Hoeflea sp.]MBV1785227.1 hypothetical protein [Hoeflea sp.]
MKLKNEKRSERITAIQRFVDEGLASGSGSKTKEALFEEARVRLDAQARR